MGRGGKRIKREWHIKCEGHDLFIALWCTVSVLLLQQSGAGLYCHRGRYLLGAGGAHPPLPQTPLLMVVKSLSHRGLCKLS